MAHRIAILASPDCLASGISATADLLMAANGLAAQFMGAQAPVFAWQVVSRDGAPVRGSNGYPVAVDGGLELAESADVIVIPSFSFTDIRHFKSELAASGKLLQWLRARHEAGATLAGACSGAFLLAEAGLLDGVPATTNWWLSRLFAQRYPRVELRLEEMLVCQDRLITAGAALSQLDLTLYLIERLAGRQLARLCGKFMVLDGRRSSQAPYMVPTHLKSSDPLVARAEAWIGKHLSEEIRIDELAKHLAVSPRTLIRRFQRATGLSPQAFLQQQRIELARTLMETTDLRLGQILERVGYQDESAFRRLFKRHTSFSPGEYSRRYGLRGGEAA